MALFRFGHRPLMFKGKQETIGQSVGQGLKNARTAGAIIHERGKIVQAKKARESYGIYETSLRKSYDQEIAEREKKIASLKGKFRMKSSEKKKPYKVVSSTKYFPL